MPNDEHKCVPELAASGDGGRDTDGVVEGQTKGLVDLLTTLAAVEQVLLDVVANGEQSTAGGVGRSVHAVGASDPAGERTYFYRDKNRTCQDSWGGGWSGLIRTYRSRPGELREPRRKTQEP